MQAGLFDSPAQACPKSSFGEPPSMWGARALAKLFKDRKAALDKLSPEKKNEIAQAAWVYARARTASLASPTLALDSERILFGHVNIADEVRIAVRVLNLHCLVTADIPHPPEECPSAIGQDARAAESPR